MSLLRWDIYFFKVVLVPINQGCSKAADDGDILSGIKVIEQGVLALN